MHEVRRAFLLCFRAQAGTRVSHPMAAHSPRSRALNGEGSNGEWVTQPAQSICIGMSNSFRFIASRFFARGLVCAVGETVVDSFCECGQGNLRRCCRSLFDEVRSIAARVWSDDFVVQHTGDQKRGTFLVRA